jgi:hypothetical protein
MTKAFHYLAVLFTGLCFVCGIGCTQERLPCMTPASALKIKTVHYKYDTSTKTVDTALPAAVFVPMTRDSIKKGSVSVPSSTFDIHLSSVDNSCTWLFTTDSLKHKFDTVVFFYQRKLQFVSNACGYTYFFYLDSIHCTNKIIDSLHITDYNITNNVNTSHLQLYIHPNY